MKPGRRALVGAVGGALLVLVAQRATRSNLLSVFRPHPPLASLLVRPPLAKPTDRPSGAAYIHAGVERSALKADEQRTLVKITEEGQKADPDNAFWPLARFALRDGKGPDARRDFHAASGCRVYNDFQGAALTADLRRVAARVGGVQAWMYAAVAPRRSGTLIRRIKDAALATLMTLPPGRDRTEFAYETIRNGTLVRDGSRRLALGFVGIAMIEGATIRFDMNPDALRDSPRRLWIAKGLLTQDLRKYKGEETARACDKQFRINDSWQAFSDVEDPDGRFRALAIAAVFVDVLPGGFLMGAMVGGLVWLFSRRLAAIAHDRNRFTGPGLAATSLSLLVAGTLLGYPVVGIAAGACALVPAIAPERPRRYDGFSLGPLHVFVVGCLGAAILLGVALAAVAQSLPGTVLPQQGPYGAWLGDARRLASFFVVTLGASTLVAPAWAVVRRLPTTALAAKTYADLGSIVAIVGLALAILASPLSYALDRRIADHLAGIALNEPTYYKPYSPEE